MSGLWEAVRHGADVIVTLRQENAILQSQLVSLKHTESDLQSKIDGFLERISSLEQQTKPGPTEIDRLEDEGLAQRIRELETELEEAMLQRSDTEERLARAQQALAETQQQLSEHSEVSQQVLQLRSELEARTQLLQEMQQAQASREPAGDGATAYTIQLEDERDRLTLELNRALEIIDRYRAAGLRHLEEPGTEDQLALFLHEASSVQALAPSQNLEEVAGRLEDIARQLEELAGLS